MIVKVLAENRLASEELKQEHGLSLYIETKRHKLLFDTGASALFAENAAKMKVDLSAVDLAVLSHGHYDHGGGLKELLNVNAGAPVYLRRNAFEEYYTKKPNGDPVWIGLDRTLLPNDRFVFTGDGMVLDEELELFSHVTERKFSPAGNSVLLKKVGDALTQDDFTHEQNLILTEDGKFALIAGCAHNGIVNILEHFHTAKGRFPDYVMGGFHLYNPSTRQSESPVVIAEIADYLMRTGAVYYTCHCTGLESFNRLKELMGDRVNYIATGDVLRL